MSVASPTLKSHLVLKNIKHVNFEFHPSLPAIAQTKKPPREGRSGEGDDLAVEEAEGRVHGQVQVVNDGLQVAVGGLFPKIALKRATAMRTLNLHT
jgi:hypothetical protein